jgi:retron-type reverse transcriptase
MKTYKQLYSQIIEFDALYAAFRRARRGGKRGKAEVAAFEYHLEEELWQLHEELATFTYQPGAYRNFYIIERKKRKISAAPFRDRVVHHALCAVIQPIFEARMIADSYACRVGKGTHRAADRAQDFARADRYVLKCDIQQFFPSIDHAILKRLLARPIADPATLGLIERIIDSGAGLLDSETTAQWFPGDTLFDALRPKGLPIGNLTSQFWANVYLNALDQFVKRELHCRHYVRYADDFLLFHENKAQLHAWKADVVDYLATLRLRLHERKAVISPTRDGVDFVGYRIFPDHRRLRKDNVHAFARRLRGLREAWKAGDLPLQRVTRSVQAWTAHAAHANTYHLRERLLAEVVF